MTGRSESFFLPGRLPGLNEVLAGGRKHGRYSYNNTKQLYTSTIAQIATASMQPWPNGAHVALTFYEPNKRRDPDNFTAVAAKFILDGLVQGGILADDGWDEVLSLRYMWDMNKDKPGIHVCLRDFA